MTPNGTATCKSDCTQQKAAVNAIFQHFLNSKRDLKCFLPKVHVELCLLCAGGWLLLQKCTAALDIPCMERSVCLRKARCNQSAVLENSKVSRGEHPNPFGTIVNPGTQLQTDQEVVVKCHRSHFLPPNLSPQQLPASQGFPARWIWNGVQCRVK